MAASLQRTCCHVRPGARARVGKRSAASQSASQKATNPIRLVAFAFSVRFPAVFFFCRTHLQRADDTRSYKTVVVVVTILQLFFAPISQPAQQPKNRLPTRPIKR